jgi:hypothetical protein
MRAIGKEHFKLVLVECFPSRSKEEVAPRITTLAEQDANKDETSSKPQGRADRTKHQGEDKYGKQCALSREITKLQNELGEQRKLMRNMQEMIQQLTKMLAQKQASTTLDEDAKALSVELQPDETKPMTIFETEHSEPLDARSMSAAKPPGDHSCEPPSDTSSTPPFLKDAFGAGFQWTRENRPPPKGVLGTRTPEHFDISDDEIEEEQYQATT